MPADRRAPARGRRVTVKRTAKAGAAAVLVGALLAALGCESDGSARLTVTTDPPDNGTPWVPLNLTGQWRVDSRGYTRTLDIRQSGATLTGTVSGGGDDTVLTGSVDSNRVTLASDGITGSGTAGLDSMSGTWRGGGDSDAWRARRR
jgi:hypothetical protein